MTTINYNATELGKGEKLVEWPSLAAGDVGQEFDMTGYELVSLHQYKSGGANLPSGLRQSNNLGATGVSAGNFSATTDEIFDDATFPIKSRYLWPVAISGSGTLNVSVLVKETK